MKRFKRSIFGHYHHHYDENQHPKSSVVVDHHHKINMNSNNSAGYKSSVNSIGSYAFSDFGDFENEQEEQPNNYNSRSKSKKLSMDSKKDVVSKYRMSEIRLSNISYAESTCDDCYLTDEEEEDSKREETTASVTNSYYSRNSNASNNSNSSNSRQMIEESAKDFYRTINPTTMNPLNNPKMFLKHKRASEASTYNFVPNRNDDDSHEDINALIDDIQGIFKDYGASGGSGSSNNNSNYRLNKLKNNEELSYRQGVGRPGGWHPPTDFSDSLDDMGGNWSNLIHSKSRHDARCVHQLEEGEEEEEDPIEEEVVQDPIKITIKEVEEENESESDDDNDDDSEEEEDEEEEQERKPRIGLKLFLNSLSSFKNLRDSRNRTQMREGKKKKNKNDGSQEEKDRKKKNKLKLKGAIRGVAFTNHLQKEERKRRLKRLLGSLKKEGVSSRSQRLTSDDTSPTHRSSFNSTLKAEEEAKDNRIIDVEKKKKIRSTRGILVLDDDDRPQKKPHKRSLRKSKNNNNGIINNKDKMNGQDDNLVTKHNDRRLKEKKERKRRSTRRYRRSAGLSGSAKREFRMRMSTLRGVEGLGG